jgi:hypothetical protein
METTSWHSKSDARPKGRDTNSSPLTRPRDYLDRALNIWGDRPWFYHKSARTSFLRGKHLQGLDGDENREQGQVWIDRALLLRKSLVPDEETRELEVKDFDDLVCFWSI